MEKILIDTDVIIDFLRGYDKRIKEFFGKILQQEIDALTSAVTVMELYSGKDVEAKEKLQILEELLSYFEMIALDVTIAKVAGNLKRKYSLGLADAVIAATAFSTKSKLFTFNSKHFQKVKEVEMFKW